MLPQKQIAKASGRDVSEEEQMGWDMALKGREHTIHLYSRGRTACGQHPGVLYCYPNLLVNWAPRGPGHGPAGQV